MKYEKQIYLITILVLVGILLSSYLPNFSHSINIDKMSEKFISLKNSMQENLISQGEYRCCLKEPCTYCLAEGEKECDCLDKIVNGEHPCGECIGEILEGNGNPYLKEYFAEAIADELGTKYLGTIQEIIDEKYA